MQHILFQPVNESFAAASNAISFQSCVFDKGDHGVDYRSSMIGTYE